MSLQSYIYDEAERLKEKYDTNDPMEIISQKGIVLRFCNIFSDIKGYYSVIDDIRYIGINTNLDPIVKKFVLAHELGHDAFHRTLTNNFRINEIALYGNKYRIEREANEFAANLLLSDKLIFDELNEGGEYNPLNDYPAEIIELKLDGMRRRGIKI